MTATKGATKSSKSGKSAARPFSEKSRELEPRGRPLKGQAALSGATPDDPLISVQILKVRQSVWEELNRAAAEKQWHRSVLVRNVLDEWVARRKAGKQRKVKAESQEAAA